jgi:hypothetical protein
MHALEVLLQQHMTPFLRCLGLHILSAAVVCPCFVHDIAEMMLHDLACRANTPLRGWIMM